MDEQIRDAPVIFLDSELERATDAAVFHWDKTFPNALPLHASDPSDTRLGDMGWCFNAA